MLENMAGMWSRTLSRKENVLAIIVINCPFEISTSFLAIRLLIIVESRLIHHISWVLTSKNFTYSFFIRTFLSYTYSYYQVSKIPTYLIFRRAASTLKNATISSSIRAKASNTCKIFFFFKSTRYSTRVLYNVGSHIIPAGWQEIGGRCGIGIERVGRGAATTAPVRQINYKVSFKG